MQINRGFVSLEAMVGVALVAIIALVIIHYSVFALSLSSGYQNNIVALNLINAFGEEISTLPDTDPSLSPWGTHALYFGDHSERNLEPLPELPYTVTWTVDRDQPIVGMKTIQLAITWSDSRILNDQRHRLAFRVIR